MCMPRNGTQSCEDDAAMDERCRACSGMPPQRREASAASHDAPGSPRDTPRRPSLD